MELRTRHAARPEMENASTKISWSLLHRELLRSSRRISTNEIFRTLMRHQLQFQTVNFSVPAVHARPVRLTLRTALPKAIPRFDVLPVFLFTSEVRHAP